MVNPNLRVLFASSANHVRAPQVTANNEYKFKQWNADNKSCRRTTIGPTFGGPINRLENIKHIHTDGQSRPTEFVAYGTADKVVGLVSSAEPRG